MTLALVPSHPRRLVFLGTPTIAVQPLRALVAAGFDVPLVITRIDKRRGRGSDVAPSPVKRAALDLGLRVSHQVDEVLEVGADLGVVVAFGQLIRPHVLQVVPMVNLHFSLLPRWRGAAPMERALLDGDAETGVDLMQVEEGLDTGGIFAEVRTEITADDTGDSLRARLTSIGTDLLIAQLQGGLGVPVAQLGEPLYAAKLSTEDVRIDWSRSVEVIDRQVRLGGAWTTVDGRRLKVLAGTVCPDRRESESSNDVEARLTVGTLVGGRVQTGDGILELTLVQPEGKAQMSAREWQNGSGRSAQGRVLGS